MYLSTEEMGSRSNSPCSSFRLSLFFLFFLSFNAHATNGSNSITPTQSLTGSDTITSPGGIFELGFFTPNQSQNLYIGIWYKQIPEHTVVWVANRETPLPSTTNSILKISKDGNLVLISPSNLPVWSTNLSSIISKSTVAVLEDTGNLVLRDGSNSSHVHWQSFDHPTHVWLPYGWLGLNKITGEYQRLTSWKGPEDPASGPFSIQMDPTGINQYILLWNGTEIYWSSGPWNGEIFSMVPEVAYFNTYNFSFIEDKQRKYFTYRPTDASTSPINLRIMDYTGQMEAWVRESNQWRQFWAKPVTQCGVFAFCGPFGNCNERSYPFCTCLHGFEPKFPKDWNLGSWSGGCVRRTPLACGKNGSSTGEKDKFLAMPDVKLPTGLRSLAVGNAESCESACLNDCSCTAYAFESNCSIWSRDLLNLQQQPSDDDDEAGTLYVRLAASELNISGGRKGMCTGAIIGVIFAAVFVMGFFLLLIWRYQQRLNRVSLKPAKGSLIAFSYRGLQIVTKNFSDKLGAGGFGSVFKGILPDLTTVAVKKLEGFSQGEKQFRTEVSTIGTIQHINLICLRGFCSEPTKRLLVYDYMPNGSLGSHLFNKNSEVLSWPVRYQIATGIAKGLAYLHEKCRDCIIHCDIKPENILLDSDFCPKVADFGLAKLFGREFSRVLTTFRGTRGYLAPEWISGQAITPKADVYSYGMMVFEIISGRRNTTDEGTFFPTWALRKINQGEIQCMLDNRLEGNVNMEELDRTCKVAGWCIQDDERKRPTMGLIVQILEGVLEVNIPPVPRSLQILTENESTVFSSESSASQSSQHPSVASNFSV